MDSFFFYFFHTSHLSLYFFCYCCYLLFKVESTKPFVIQSPSYFRNVVAGNQISCIDQHSVSLYWTWVAEFLHVWVTNLLHVRWMAFETYTHTASYKQPPQPSYYCRYLLRLHWFKIGSISSNHLVVNNSNSASLNIYKFLLYFCSQQYEFYATRIRCPPTLLLFLRRKILLWIYLSPSYLAI